MDRVGPPVSELRERGRDHYRRRLWIAAFDALSQADEIEPLAAADLWLLAWSAHLTGRDEDFARTMSRAYRAHLDAGEPLPAARCAGWLGAMLAMAGESGPAAGWLSRAQRLIEREGVDCPERGFLFLLAAFDHADAGDHDAMLAAATQSFEVAERFGDADLAAMALILQGRARLARGETKAGLALLDEAMVSVTTDQLLPALTGLAYCNVIDGCQEVYDLRRSQEWTAALTRWCDGQPDLVPYAGQCLVHRSELSQLHGDWARAWTKRSVRAIGSRDDQQSPTPITSWPRCIVCGASSPRPSWPTVVSGSSGDSPSQVWPFCGSRRAVSVSQPPLLNGYSTKPRIAPAGAGCCPRTSRSCWLHTKSARPRTQLMSWSRSPRRSGHPFSAPRPRMRQGAVLLAQGDPAGALIPLRRAVSMWRQMDAPYESARARVLVGQACRELGDADSAEIEFEAVGQVFQKLGAAPDAERLRQLIDSPERSYPSGLTAREVQILSLVATGRTNREIASTLMISEHTVARHLQNIFSKLGVSSRTAAAAFALDQSLI